jgi:transposase
VSVECDFKVLFRHGGWYLILPFRRPLKTRSSLANVDVDVDVDVESIAAIDPGVRVPFTVYSPEGTVAEVGVNCNCTRVLDKHLLCIANGKEQVQDVYAQVAVERECRFLDRKMRKKQRRRIRIARKKSRGVEDKLKRVIRDFHYKTAHYLLQRFKTIILPHTSSHRWRTNSLAAVTKRRSMMLRHGMFASRLIQTASDYVGSHIIRCTEAYTSKQCGACGELNDKLGGSKTFNCQKCGAVADRDVHAARNILLRCLQL